MAAGQVTSVVVAIDTTDYSGNFEREMCAFVTGQVGECGVGEELVEEAQEELAQDTFNNTGEWIEEHIVSEPDDSDCPCCRPCSIWPTPGRANNGSGGHFNEEDLPEEKCFAGTHWPAYESVAIFFDEVPPKEVIDVIIDRAQRFATERPDWKSWKGEKEPLTITRVRVLVPSLVKPRQIDHIEVARYEV